jgi:hypothetical protein
MNWHQVYGSTEGPLGFPMGDKQARAIESLLKSLPKDSVFGYRKSVMEKAPSEILPGERSDVSWISTESTDRAGHVVLAKGMNNSQFQANPLVTLGHAYWMPPVGKSLWQKRTSDGPLVGVKAKTVYPPRPKNLPEGEDWPPDKAFPLVQGGLLSGKSIGFLPLKVHQPKRAECEQFHWDPDSTELVIDEWLLLEYACVYLPCNQDTLVESVSKGLVVPEAMLKAMGVEAEKLTMLVAGKGENKDGPPTLPVTSPGPMAFTPLSEIEKAVCAGIRALDLDKIAREACKLAWERRQGRV